MSNVLFVTFGVMVVLPVIFLIFTRNIIHAVLALVVALLGISAMYVLLKAEYLAVVQILIYAGGIIVLLIFGIMLTRRTGEQGVFTDHRGLFGGALVFVFFLALLWKLIHAAETFRHMEGYVYKPEADQVKELGVLFLTDHLIAFELIAFILLLALIGAAFLAKKSSET